MLRYRLIFILIFILFFANILYPCKCRKNTPVNIWCVDTIDNIGNSLDYDWVVPENITSDSVLLTIQWKEIEGNIDSDYLILVLTIDGVIEDVFCVDIYDVLCKKQSSLGWYRFSDLNGSKNIDIFLDRRRYRQSLVIFDLLVHYKKRS